MSDDQYDNNMFNNYIDIINISLCSLEVIELLIPHTATLIETNIGNITVSLDLLEDKKKTIEEFISNIIVNLQFQDRCNQNLDCSKHIIKTVVETIIKATLCLKDTKHPNNINAIKYNLIITLTSHFKLSNLRHSFQNKLYQRNLLKSDPNSDIAENNDTEFF